MHGPPSRENNTTREEGTVTQHAAWPLQKGDKHHRSTYQALAKPVTEPTHAEPEKLPVYVHGDGRHEAGIAFGTDAQEDSGRETRLPGTPFLLHHNAYVLLIERFGLEGTFEGHLAHPPCP